MDECISCHTEKDNLDDGWICEECNEWHNAHRKNYTKPSREHYKSPPSSTKKDVWMKTGGICWYCGKQTHPFGSDKDAFVVEHFVSRMAGGSGEIDNLVPACVRCNTIKKGHSLEEFRRFFGGEMFFFERRENERV